MVMRVNEPFSSISDSLGLNQTIAIPVSAKKSAGWCFVMMNWAILAIGSHQSSWAIPCCVGLGDAGWFVGDLPPRTAFFGHGLGAAFIPWWRLSMFLRAPVA